MATMTTEMDKHDKDDVDNSAPKQRQSRRALIALIAIIVCFVVALTVGLVLNNDDDNDDDDIALMKREGLITDCLPELRRNETRMRRSKEECLQRGCLFKPQMEEGAPWCHVVKTDVYTVGNLRTDDTSMTAELTTDHTSSQGINNVFRTVTVAVEFQTDYRIRIKLYPTDVTERWEIPASVLNIESTNDKAANSATSKLNVTIVENPFGVIVRRKDSDTVVFNSSHPGTILADQFLQLTTTIASGHLYGFGEHRHLRLHHDLTWKSWSMFTRDTGPNSDWNLYGHHPVYLNVEEDGKANMVLLKNSNAMEVLLQPEPFPAVTFTTIGGVLDFYVFVGDSPSDVTSNYIKSIGLPAFPPYWSLGYHLCRWGYKNLTDMRTVTESNIEAQIPFDGQWADIDTFYKKYPFTYDPHLWADFPAFVTKLQAGHRHFVTIVDPGVGANDSIYQEINAMRSLKGFSSYDMLDSGKNAGIFVLNSTKTGAIHGKVWPGETAFPDFTNPETQAWWTERINHYVNEIGIKADALWIDMNEPASFVPGSVRGCANNSWNFPAWCPNILGAGEECRMFDKTLCMDAQHHLGNHYNVHSLYGHTMAINTYRSLASVYTNKRPWTMTRSSFVGTGSYATKWTGDNSATWEDMHYSIITIMEFGFFGFPMNGADICGFWLEPSFELCVRWHQLGAFYPFARNHNGFEFKHQDPASFGQEFVDLVKPALYTRYKFLPYFYTLLYRASVDGRMVMQPLFYQFPEDENTLKIDTQFMLGSAMLISPVLTEGASSVSAYFPRGRWFDYLTGEEINSEGSAFDLQTPLEKFNLHLRGGHVIPWQEPGLTTYSRRENDLGLLLVLDETGRANGEMFWDDGESKLTDKKDILIKFIMEEAGNLTIKAERASFVAGGRLYFTTVEISGLPRLPAKVTSGTGSGKGTPVSQSNYKYINEGSIRITGLKLPLTQTTWITWTLY